MPEELTQAEKLATLHNDLLVARTYLAHARAGALELGGRLAGSAPKVTAIPVVPRLPEGHWSNDQAGPEPPLGYSVNEVAVVGELHEVARASEAGSPEKSEPSTVPPVVDGASAGTVVERGCAPTVPTFRRRRF